MSRLIFCIIFLILFYNYNNFFFGQSGIKKEGGICFRTDDDQPIEKYQEYAELFNQYYKNFTCAINFENDPPLTPEYVTMLKDLQSKGHEVMDHTPRHRTNYFVTFLPTDYYINHPGVHRIYGEKIELNFVNPDIAFSKRTGYVNINGETITSPSGEFAQFSKSDCYLFFPSINQLVFIDDQSGWVDANTVKGKDFWRNSINLGSYQNIKYYNFDYNNIHLTVDGLKALAEETIRVTEYYGIQRPYTWIQPGGYFPHVYRNEVKQACGDALGFKSAGTFPNPSLKVFNEYNPDNDKQFGMNFGDFRDDIWTLEHCKEFIADRIAKHYVAIGESHFTWGYDGLLGGWEGFLDRTEDLIEWCIEKDIPIKTYSQWADILYSQISDPYQNVFPNLSIDRDENGAPDGYAKRSSTYDGIWVNNDGVASSNYYSYSINKTGGICFIDDLGGIEKGENDFEIWTKGASDNFIEVVFKIGSSEYIYKFSAESSDWKKYDLSQSLNGNISLNIPINISVIDITIRCSNYSSGTVKISGMHLSQKRNLADYFINAKIFLEGSYLTNKTMSTSINNFLPKNQPFNIQPWFYEGNESVSNIPNSEIVDWILVSLKNNPTDLESVARRAGFLKKDGHIVDLDGESPLRFSSNPGSYYIQIEHRNHLKVMSANSILLE